MSSPRNTPIRVAVLGPVLVEGRAGDLAEPPGALGKSLIVALALARGGTLSVGALTDELWGEHPPRNAKAALQTLVSRVRGGCADGLLESGHGGYTLAVKPEETDFGLAGRLFADARDFAAAGDHASAADALAEALNLWRGEPGAELAPDGPGAELAERAGTLRTQLRRTHAECRMSLGQTVAAVADLQALTTASPLDEELHVLLMRALAAAGRRNDALAVFARLRTALREQLGTSPSQQAVQLNAELLHDDDEPVPVDQPGRVTIGLRTPPNELLGRDGDLLALEQMIQISRLTTILGPGGIGKTRLAQELGRRAAETMPAVIVVELASVRTGEDITLALASTLGIREAQAGRLQLNDPGVRLDLRERILAALGERRTLLIVDNCEHIVDAAAAWTEDVLASTSAVRVLATSRSPLAISGESVYQLDSLASENGDSELGPAVTLFMERARAARPGATLPVDVIGRLCTRLDGLPLAIELAAARVRSMSVEEIERRLGNRFALLTGGERTAPERHRTLMAVIDWSWNLLGSSERVLLRRLSRFPDGFSADAAQIVGAGASGPDVANDLDGLVNQSLVSVSEDAATGLMRYRMLETVREFGDMALVNAGEDDRVRNAMFDWARAFALTVMPDLDGADQPRTFRLLAAEQDNLVTVLREAIDAHRPDAVVDIFAPLGYYWSMRGAHSDAASFARPVLLETAGYRPDAAHVDAATATYVIIAGTSMFGDLRTGLRARSRLRALRKTGRPSVPQIDALATLLLAAPDVEKATALLAQYRNSSNARIAGLGALLSAQFAENAGLTDEAFVHAKQAYDLAEKNRHTWSQATAAQALAELHSQSGHPQEALHWAEISHREYTSLQAGGDLQQIDWMIAMNEVAAEHPERGRATFETFVSGDQDTLGFDYVDLRGIGWAGLAEIALQEGRNEEGLENYRQGIGLFDSQSGPQSPWFLIIAAAGISASVFANVEDQTWIIALAKRLRSRMLAARRLSGYVDLPVTGALLRGLSAPLLQPERPGSAPRTAEAGMRLLALAGAMGGRQDLPSLNQAKHEKAAVAAHGQAALDAARASVADLALDAAVELAHETLRDPALGELFFQ